MKLRFLILLAACATAPAPQSQPKSQSQAQTLAPPIARKQPHPQSLHGRALDDDYFWLRKKGTAEVESYLQAENAYTDAMMKPTAPLESALYDEMLARIQEDDVSVPYRKHGYYYYTRIAKGQQYPIHCRKSAKGAAKDDLVGETAKSPEEITVDLNQLGKNKKFISLAAYEVSDDSRWLAYSTDDTGFRQYTLHFKDLTTGQLAPESIPRVDFVTWAADGKTVFYVVEHPTSKRSYRLYRHVVGSDPAKDPLLYEEKDEMFYLAIERTRSEAFEVLSSFSMTTSEVRLCDAKKPEGEWRLVAPRQHDHEYSVDHRGDQLFIRTNLGADGKKAINFRLMTAPVATPDPSHWVEQIPNRPDVMLEGIEVFSDHVILLERADALPRLRVMQKGIITDIPMLGAIYSVSPAANAEFDTPAYRYHYQSPVTPDTIYDFDVHKRARTQRKRLTVKNFDPSQFTTERVHATAKDGTRIPISLVYKKGLAADPKNPHPMLLYAYGSYGIPLPVTFSSERISLLDRGVVFALAHIRGGGDLGKPWHEGGRMSAKMNTFTDFIASAEELIKVGWTARDRLSIMGGSAGGLLMGAVTNLRPDLWKAVVTKMPFVDVINTMLDESLPETVIEFEEWGNPKKKDEFEWMIQYSPYDNVAKKEYPAILVESSYNDSQVMYWEPAKYVARLRALKTDKNPLLFKVNMEPAGHGGQSGRYNRLHETAFDYAWILTQLGITK